MHEVNLIALWPFVFDTESNAELGKIVRMLNTEDVVDGKQTRSKWKM